MNVKCPHCGTQYEVEKNDMYRYTKCSVCGKGFVVGTTTNMRASDSSSTPSTSASAKSSRSTQSRPQRKPVSPLRPSEVTHRPSVTKRDVRNPSITHSENAYVRHIKIYGYKEWFGGIKNPVRIYGEEGNVICEVPYNGVVNVVSRVNEHLRFCWADMAGVLKEAQIVVGDVRNIILSINRKDWTLNATKTNNVDELLMASSRANVRFTAKHAVRMIAPIVPIAVFLFVKCGLGEKIGDWGRSISDLFDDSPIYILWRAHEPNKSDVQKILDECYKSQNELDFSGWWYDCKCPRCGEKLKYGEKLKWVNGSKKVKCSVCDYKWKVK